MKRSSLEQAWRDLMQTYSVDNIPGVLPVRGQVRASNGIVHRIIGNFTYCNESWVLKSEYALDMCASGWEVVDMPATCILCVGDV